MKLEPGTCAECAAKAVTHSFFASGMAWHISPEDRQAHWGQEVNARVCGEMKAVEFAVVCGRNFVAVTKA